MRPDNGGFNCSVSKNCCYKCGDRVLGCHDSCAKYLEYKAKLEAAKEKEKIKKLGYSATPWARTSTIERNRKKHE